MAVKPTRSACWIRLLLIAGAAGAVALWGDVLPAAPLGGYNPGSVAPAGPENTTQPAARGDEWLVKHSRLVERAKKGDIELLFLGDSITSGWDKDVWQHYYGAYGAANFGVHGDKTQNVLWRLLNGEADDISPKVVVLLIGTNNVTVNGCTAEQVADGVKAIVQTIHQKMPESKVLLLGIFPRGPRPGPTREKIKKVNEILAKLDDGKKVRFLDIGEKFLEGDGSISMMVMTDYLYLTPKGFAIWAEAMKPLLEEMLGVSGKAASQPASQPADQPASQPASSPAAPK